jgi:hypothetical protein
MYTVTSVGFFFSFSVARHTGSRDNTYRYPVAAPVQIFNFYPTFLLFKVFRSVPYNVGSGNVLVKLCENQ